MIRPNNNYPEERRVIIRQGVGGTDILNGKPLIFDGNIPLKVSSSYTKLWDSEPNKLLNIFSSSTNSAMTGQFALQGAKIWESTENLSISLDCNLYMNDSGREDVYLPALTLVQTVLPKKATYTKDDNFKLTDSIGTKLQSLIPPGPNIQDLLTIGSNGQQTDKDRKIRGLYSIKLGTYIDITNVVISEAEVEFSKQMDTEGFPISATISLKIETVEIATTDMIVGMLNRSPQYRNTDNIIKGGLHK